MKKNGLLFQIGCRPAFLRTHCRSAGAVQATAVVVKKSLAVNAVLRLNSKPPVERICPLLVTRLICAAEDRPSSAFAPTVTTRNSSIASVFSRSTGAPISLVSASLISTPSSVTLDWSLRPPATYPLGVTCACNVSSGRIPRPSIGNCVICVLVKLLPSVESSVFT